MATSLHKAIVTETESTQDDVRELAASGVATPILVVAGRQSGARGRSGAVWVSAPRALACSLGVDLPWAMPELGVVTLTAAVAAARVLGAEVRLKWPNDLMVADGKLGGILAESHGGLVVVGLGANLWWPDFPAGWTALSETDPGPNLGAELGAAGADDLLAMLDEGPQAWPHDEYRSLSATVGRHVVAQAGQSGLAVDVDATGALLVETHEGIERVTSGSLTHV